MKKILIVEARYYPEISDLLLAGAIDAITKSGYSYEVLNVSGALEIPLAISFARKSKNYDGFVALGCVIRGETTHYDIVANQSAEALLRLAIDEKLAVGNGILTVENKSQAIARADIKQKNKGGFAANAAIQMIEIKNKFTN